ncbi:hypothetical protein HDV57DRAFT_193150 [Trichoderma longibrachiatum]
MSTQDGLRRNGAERRLCPQPGRRRKPMIRRAAERRRRYEMKIKIKTKLYQKAKMRRSYQRPVGSRHGRPKRFIAGAPCRLASCDIHSTRRLADATSNPPSSQAAASPGIPRPGWRISGALEAAEAAVLRASAPLVVSGCWGGVDVILPILGAVARVSRRSLGQLAVGSIRIVRMRLGCGQPEGAWARVQTLVGPGNSCTFDRPRCNRPTVPWKKQGGGSPNVPVIAGSSSKVEAAGACASGCHYRFSLDTIYMYSVLFYIAACLLLFSKHRPHRT